MFPFQRSRPLIIAHRGACGTLPEQTIEAFELALEQGADGIEFDVVPTRDNRLVARHENELSATTNVAEIRGFHGRRTTKIIGGATIAGWFTEDFTSEEIQSLRARQRFPFRDHSHDDRYAIPTLDTILEWRTRKAGHLPLFIEIKHAAYFTRIGLDPAQMLLRTLAQYQLTDRNCGIFLMSFEAQVLRDLRARTRNPLVQLFDVPHARLAEIAGYADGIGPWKRLIVPTINPAKDGAIESETRLDSPTLLISQAHSAGLFVCSWTFRDEPRFLALDYGGDSAAEYRQFAQLGVEGVISDFPATAIRALS